MNNTRWATLAEIKRILEGVNIKNGATKSGLPVLYDSKTLYVDTNEAHNLVIGSIGSGKTQSIILPMLKLSISAGESSVVIDPKGEIYAKLAHKLEEEKYKVIVLDLDDSRYGNSWNPLDLAYKLYKEGNKDKALEVIEDLGYYLFSDTQRIEVDPFWTNSTINYFTGLVLYLFDNAKENEINLISVLSIANYLNDTNKATDFIQKLNSESVIYMKVAGILQAPPETRGSILSVFNQKIERFLSKENLQNMLSDSDFDITKISNEKTVVFIVSGINDHSRSLIPLFIDQVIDVTSTYGNQIKRLNLLLDEFDSLVPIKDFAIKLNYCRSINVRVTVNIQSFAHLANMYSKEDVEILKMCFGNVVYLLSDDLATLEEISKTCGMKNQDTPLISVSELKTMSYFEAIVLMTRMLPFKTKLLPDYQASWGYEMVEQKMPERKENKIEIFSMEK